MPPHVGGRQRDELSERARMIDADALGPSALDPAPGHAVAASPAYQVTFAADQIADGESLDLRAELDDLADEFVAAYERHGHNLLAPAVPFVDVHLGTAHPGLQDPDQHIVPADRRHRDILNPQPGLG